MIPEAAALGAGLPKQTKQQYEQVCDLLVNELGCDVYVKTIYVGFSIDGEMVSAVYPRRDFLEIAMALPEDVEGREFKDATHLTWPTMPVAIEVRTTDDLTGAIGHLESAAARVVAGEHDVRRPNDHFIGRVKRGTSRS